MNGEEHESDEEEQIEVNEMIENDFGGEITVASSDVYESSPVDLHVEEDTNDGKEDEEHEPKQVEDEPKPAASVTMRDDGGVPMDYRARRALREKKKAMEEGGCTKSFTWCMYILSYDLSC